MRAARAIDWHALLVPSHPVAEFVIRGTAMYVLLFLCLLAGISVRHWTEPASDAACM